MFHYIHDKLLDESEIEYMDFPDDNSAFGIYIENAVFVFHDAQMCVKSYPDTGVFLLLKGSYTASSDNKYQEYILEGKTIKNIIVMSSVKPVCGNFSSSFNFF
mgnify:CR=1 FL=1